MQDAWCEFDCIRGQTRMLAGERHDSQGEGTSTKTALESVEKIWDGVICDQGTLETVWGTTATKVATSLKTVKSLREEVTAEDLHILVVHGSVSGKIEPGCTGRARAGPKGVG